MLHHHNLVEGMIDRVGQSHQKLITANKNIGRCWWFLAGTVIKSRLLTQEGPTWIRFTKIKRNRGSREFILILFIIYVNTIIICGVDWVGWNMNWASIHLVNWYGENTWKLDRWVDGDMIFNYAHSFLFNPILLLHYIKLPIT